MRAKYLFCTLIELCYFVLTSIPVLLRMTVLSNAEVYRQNVMMNANLVYLGYVLLILGLFNLIFISGFFKTAYKFGRPFVGFILLAFLVVGVGEALFHIPALSALNSFGFDCIALQAGVLASGLLAFSLMTLVSMHLSIKRFERIEL